MFRVRAKIISFAIITFLVGSPVIADDGEKILKNMSRNTQLTVLPEEVGVPTAEAEHAFIDMMRFYVPSQQASGLVESIIYNNADGALVETLGVAKPLISVFINGPAIGVEGTPFAHSFMDTFAAVSLDDGVTWKTTNLSESADQSSFELGQNGGGGGGDPLPGDHNIRLGNAFHKSGYDTPYTAHCSECHGQGLQGVAQVPSCYSCHDNKWEEPTPVDIGPIIYMAELEGQDKKNSKLKIKGENASDSAEVTILNAITGHPVGTTEAEDNGKFAFEEKFKGEELPPCVVMAEYTDDTGTVLTGPSLSVVDKKTGEPIKNCEGLPHDLTNYPGGVHNVFHATQGNKVLAAWPSRYCDQGKPAYALSNDLVRLDAIVDFIQTGEAAEGDINIPPLDGFNLEDDLYLVDAFGVAGSQGSIEFADEGFPQAGEVPFGCVWTSRGVLLAGDDPRTDAVEASHMVWTKAERLTSGRRDPFRIEVKAVKGAGFVITWQEDPEGLRPGQGLGPGEGWSGAVAHSQTDVWYSFVNWQYFDYVDNGAGASINIVNHDLTTSGRPQVFVPMAIPMRLTNNAKCNTDGTNVTDPDLYCNDEGTDEVAGAADYGLKNQCADTVDIPTGPNNVPTPICVSEDGIPNVSNTASTRPRLSLQASGTGSSAWVIVAAEESKGLGAFFFLPDGTPCTEGDENCTEEIGKNQWYFSFDMGTPDTSADLTETGLVKNLVNQGNMLNQPEVDWRTGEFYPVVNTAQMWDFGTYNYDLYNTEIARRSSLLVQSIAKATASTSGLLATPAWKQGPMRQGGPADTMLRRITNQGTSANPYAFTNIVCENVDDSIGWILTDGSNPYYPDGICTAPATNLSGVVPDTCVDTDGGAVSPCPTVDFTTTPTTFGIGDTDPILQGQVQGEGNTTKVLTWHQCPSGGVAQEGGDITAVTCDNDNRTDSFVNLRDQSWYNPLDVSKGHRGFLDGDMIMFLHAWSPNWRLNAKGSDRYELYVRRSFDGGETWTTTPGPDSGGTASDGTPFTGDGTVTCETYRSTDSGGGGIDEPHVCYDYEAGAAEQARNLTQHQAMRITTLDPRFAASAASITAGCVDGTDPTIDTSVMTCNDQSAFDSDLRDPSRYFMVYETGDNTTVDVGEAEPLDLFYSRAINFGDDYVVWADEVVDADLTACYPSDPHGDDVPAVLVDSGFCNEADRMNAAGDSHSSEADLEANSDGSKLYGVWTQWVFDASGEEIIESDAVARRIWWIDDYIPLNAWDFGQGSGDGTPANP